MLQLNTKVWARTGKGSAAAVRRTGFIPAVVYGNKQEARLIQLDSVDLMKSVHQGFFLSKIIELVDEQGNVERVLPRDIQFDPVTDHPIHADFLRVEGASRVRLTVPVNFVGKEVCRGLRRGGVLHVVAPYVEVLCDINAIPESFDADVSELQIGQAVLSTDVVLPEGVSYVNKNTFAVAQIKSK